MNSERQTVSSSLRTLCVLCVSALSFLFALHASSKPAAGASQESAAFRGQSQEEADRNSSGCISCHTSTDEPTMHPTRTVHIGCTDCHGGNSSVSVASGVAPNSPEYNSAKEKAHVQPRNPSFKNRSALPERTYTKWLAESAEYIKFVNPGDLRVAPETCGAAGCHAAETRAVSTSMMTHAGMLWGAALYNNGAFPAKNTRFGESYNRDGVPQSIKTSPKPTAEETRAKGVIPELDPLFRWETSQPGNVLRVLNAAAEKKPKSGIPLGKKIPASLTTSSATAALEPGCAPIPFSSVCRKRDCSTPSCRFRVPTIIPATIAGVAARPVTSSTPTTAIRHTPALMRRSATRDSALLPIRQFPRMSPAIPSNTSSRGRSLRASA